MKAFSTKQILGPLGRIDILYSSTEEGKETITLEHYSYPQGTKSYQKGIAIKQMDRQFATFLERIENDVDPLPDLENAFKSLQIVLAGHKAITSRTVVRIPGK